MTSRRWQWPSSFAIVLTAAAMALFVWLGIWQYGRMREKQAMLDAVAAVLTERKPLPLVQTVLDPARVHSYDWAAGIGSFANSDPILLDNQIRNGRVGVRVYRVFYMDKQDGSMGGNILADVGWLPMPGDRSLPKIQFPVSSRIEVRGLLAPPPSTGLALGLGIEHKDRVWLATRIDIDAIAPNVLDSVPTRQPGLAPRVLRLDPALPIGFERDLDVLPNTLPPERHLGYAVQWFAFAIVALVIFIGRHWRKVDNATK